VIKQFETNGVLSSADLSSLDRAVQENMIVDPAADEGWVLVGEPAAGVPRIAYGRAYGALEVLNAVAAESAARMASTTRSGVTVMGSL
jgi:hypothetical protein